MPKEFETKVLCKKCHQPTWHTILNKTSDSWDDEDNGLWENTTYFTLQCRGCNNVCLFIRYIFSEDFDTKTGHPLIQDSIHPSPQRDHHKPLDKTYHLPKSVKSVYLETIKACNSGLMILTAIGVRTIIEAIAIEEKITVRGIEAKIIAMVNKKIITPDGAKLLDLIRHIGNLSTHEIKQHHRDDLSLCINILEVILSSLYVFPKEADDTRKIVDGRWIRVS